MVTNQLEALLSAEQKHAYDKAIERCDLKRRSYYQRCPEKLADMSGFGIAGEIVYTNADQDVIYIEDDPFIIPSDLNDEHLLVRGNETRVYERNVLENPYSQAKLLKGYGIEGKQYRSITSSGVGYVLNDSKNETAILAAYRYSASSSYAKHWNPTIGAARYSDMADGFGEHLGLLSTIKRRALTDIGIVDPYGNLIVPQEYYKTCKEAMKEEYFEQAARKIAAMTGENTHLDIRKPKSVVDKPSELLRTPHIKKIVIAYRGKEYIRSGIVGMGKNVLDYNIMNVMRLKLHMRLRDFSYFHLQDNAKTGLALNRILALFRLDAAYKPERNLDGSLKMLTAYQYGRELDIDDIPPSREPVPAFEAILRALGNGIFQEEQRRNQQKTKAPR